MTIISKKKKIFVSYARAANKENFVQRLDVALSPIAEVFWDRKLKLGDWKNQFIDKINDCDVMIVVMSKAQQNSQYCQFEIITALEKGKAIIPIRYIKNELDPNLETLQWADFTENFDRGFSELTFRLYEQRMYPWEIYYKFDNQQLFSALASGLLPTVIATEITNWILLNKFWNRFIAQINEGKFQILNYNPHTTSDLAMILNKLPENITVSRNFAKLTTANQAKEIILPVIDLLTQIKENDSLDAGQCAVNTIKVVAKYIEKSFTQKRDFKSFADFRKTGQYTLEIASKLREIIQIHAQHLKYQE